MPGEDIRKNIIGFGISHEIGMELPVIMSQVRTGNLRIGVEGADTLEDGLPIAEKLIPGCRTAA
ncbi:hypothetical protein D3C84_1074920 [compost metagenome]